MARRRRPPVRRAVVQDSPSTGGRPERYDMRLYLLVPGEIQRAGRTQIEDWIERNFPGSIDYAAPTR